MAGTVTITLQIDKEKKKILYEFCRELGINVNEFSESPHTNDAEHRILKEGSDIFFNHNRELDVNHYFEKFIRDLKQKDEMH